MSALSPSLAAASAAALIAATSLGWAIAARRRDRRHAAAMHDDLHRRLDQAAKDIGAAHAELDAFAYTVAHDLRAPLRAIDGFSRALIEDFPHGLEPEAARLLGTVRRNAVRMGVLMDGLLAYSRLSRQPLATRAADPAAIVRRLLDDGAAARAGRDLAITIGALPACVADPGLLTRLYAALIDNSVKFTRETPAARIEIGSRIENGLTVYFVADNGAGFDMAYAGKLFGVFQRLHRAEDYDGTGIGLATAQRIVHRHGGEIWATAQPNAGATFCFTLGEPAP